MKDARIVGYYNDFQVSSGRGLGNCGLPTTYTSKIIDARVSEALSYFMPAEIYTRELLPYESSSAAAFPSGPMSSQHRPLKLQDSFIVIISITALLRRSLHVFLLDILPLSLQVPVSCPCISDHA